MVGRVCRTKAWSGLSAVTTVLRASVARSASRLWKLWTGRPSGVRAVASAWRWPTGERCALATTLDAERLGGLLVGIVVEHRREALAHVPLDMIGEHAQADVGAHARGGPMEDRSDLEIDGLDAAEGALDLGQALVGAHAGAVVEGLGGEAGADHVDAVEARLGVDLVVSCGRRRSGCR